MKTKKESKIKKVANNAQDLYSFMKDNVPNDMILSLGYVGLMSEEKLSEVPVEKRNMMILMKQFLHTMISEALKPEYYRNEDKMLSFLKMAIVEADKFHNGDGELQLFHSLDPHSEE